ncbi:MAG TPA: tetratricopeptide repeat protein [Myxococcota bacterium]|nr:tetratricopeptide repeat protein [Myxococcota bacterium]HRY94249.1 tetratricopeptide repeat protein [Myxococcota bacterium]
MGSSFKERKPPTDEEIRTYFQILREDPRSRVFAPLAESLIRRGRLDEAEKICRLGLESNPDFSDGHLALSRTLFYRFRHEEALEEVKLALGLDRHNLEAYLIAAEIFLARSQAKAAIEACMKALDLDPHNLEAQRLIQRLQGGELPASAGAAPSDPGTFRALAPTGPSQRPASVSRPASDPFQELMVDVEADAAKLLEADAQPFTALSSGSQLNRLEAGALRPGGAPPAGAGEPEPESEPTLKAGPPPAAVRPQRPPTPALPPHPVGAAPAPVRTPTRPRAAGAARSPTPLPPLPGEPGQVPAPVGAPLEPGLEAAALFDHLPEHTPIPSHRPLTELPPGPAATAVGLSRVDSTQAVIDRFGPVPGAGDELLELPLRVPRSGRAWLLFILVLGLGGAAALVYVAGLSARGTDAPGAGASTPGPVEALPGAGLAPPALPLAAAEEEIAVDAGPVDEPPADGDPADAGSAGGEPVDAGSGVDELVDTGSAADAGPADAGQAAKKPIKKPVKKPIKKPVKKPPRKPLPKRGGAR